MNEDWDDDYGASPNLLPGGLVGFGSKDGSYYALDRRDGDVAWIAHVGQAGHLTDGFAVGGIIGTPAVGRWAVARRCSPPPRCRRRSPSRSTRATPTSGSTRSLAEDPGRLLSLSAIDAETGAILWRSPLARQSYGAPTFADGVVLVPSTFSAELLAFHADTGAAALRHAGGGSAVVLAHRRGRHDLPRRRHPHQRRRVQGLRGRAPPRRCSAPRPCRRPAASSPTGSPRPRSRLSSGRRARRWWRRACRGTSSSRPAVTAS